MSLFVLCHFLSLILGTPSPLLWWRHLLMAPKVTWKSTLSLICIQLFWVIDHIFAIDIFEMDNFYSLRIDQRFLIAII